MFNLFKRFIVRIILAWMAANLILVSVPRCDVMFDLLQHTRQKNLSGGVLEHCAPHTATKVAVITGHHLCECSLAQFMVAALPRVDREPVVTGLPQARVVEAAPYHFSTIHVVANLDTPPPRSI